MTPRVDERGRVAGNRAGRRARRRNTALVWIAHAARARGRRRRDPLRRDQARWLAGDGLGAERGRRRTSPSRNSDLQAAHLRADDPAGRRSRRTPVDIVVRQDPGRRQDASTRGSTVTLFVSSGAAQKTDPVRHHDRPHRRRRHRPSCRRLGFVVVPKQRSRTPRRRAPCSTASRSRARLRPVGSTVTILVSSGPGAGRRSRR